MQPKYGLLKSLGVNFDQATQVTWENKDGAYLVGKEDVESTSGWSQYENMLAIGKVSDVKIGGITVLSSGQPIRKHPEVIEHRHHTVF